MINSNQPAFPYRLHLCCFRAWPALLLTALSVLAAEPTRVVIDTYEELAKGDNISTSIVSTGELKPAPEIREAADIDAKQVWGIVEEKPGQFLVATSPDGKLFRVKKGEKEPQLVTKFKESHLYAMTKGPKGDIYIGTSPDGKIYRLKPGEAPEPYFEPNEKYIWALAFDKDGNLYAATGIEGRLFKITAKDKGDVLYDSDETHLRSLGLHKDGKLLVGSADKGYLYRIEKADEAVVLASTGQQEVNQIAVAPDGTIYFSASGKAKTPKKSSSSSSSSSSSEDLTVLSLLKKASESRDSSSSSSKEAASSLYQIDESLYPRKVWSTGETILALTMLDDLVYATTGSNGYFYSVNKQGDITRVLKLEPGVISALGLSSNNEFLMATSGASKFFHQTAKEVAEAKYESEVIDSELFAKWGAVSVAVDGSAKLRTRSGNTPKPDKSWYPWVDIRDGKAQSPPARYLQVEATLKGTLDRLELVYLNKNLAPNLKSIDILAAGIGFETIPAPPKPPMPKTETSVRDLIGKPVPNEYLSASATRFLPDYARGQRTVVWEAKDPNSDELEFSLFYRGKPNGTEWYRLADELKDPVFSWNTSGWPDGEYHLKVTASDAKDNAPADAETAELVSKVMIVDNTAPAIKVGEPRGGKVTFTVSDERSQLHHVTVSKDGNEFKMLRPVDGILDSKTEEFEAELKNGEQLFIRAEDDGGNVSSALAKP